MASSVAVCTQFNVLNCYDETSDTKTFRLGRLDGQVLDYLPVNILRCPWSFQGSNINVPIAQLLRLPIQAFWKLR
ncbi:MAG: hypothetical protein O2966_05410 [Proteobacteria bacterium]|nr:hypothetical protein [Pseudomonadota bacterium]